MANSHEVEALGALEIIERGDGYLRSIENNYRVGGSDPFAPVSMIKKYRLLEGSLIEGTMKKTPNRARAWKLESILRVDGIDPELRVERTPFNRLTAIDPTQRLNLSIEGSPSLIGRTIDLCAPIGKGQRALIISPPKAGKTTILEEIGRAARLNHPEMDLIALLIDERPEEITHFKRVIGGEIIHASFDADLDQMLRLARLTIERAKRIVETGRDALLIIDSITRVARAFNKGASTRGARTMSGGLTAGALDFPRKLFGAARAIENGGSLTIIATCLVDTGSRMDEVIFQEFKGSGNTEIWLSRVLADARIFPAINIARSGSRKDEKLRSAEEIEKVRLISRALADDEKFFKQKALIERIAKTRSNEELLAKIAAPK